MAKAALLALKIKRSPPPSFQPGTAAASSCGTGLFTDRSEVPTTASQTLRPAPGELDSFLEFLPEESLTTDESLFWPLLPIIPENSVPAPEATDDDRAFWLWLVSSDSSAPQDS